MHFWCKNVTLSCTFEAVDATLMQRYDIRIQLEVQNDYQGKRNTPAQAHQAGRTVNMCPCASGHAPACAFKKQ
jgi:hypothetical protein